MWLYIQLASQPQAMSNHTSPDHIRPLHLRDHLSQTTQTAEATSGLHNQKISAKAVKKPSHARRPHRGLNLTAGRHRNQWMARSSHCAGI